MIDLATTATSLQDTLHLSESFTLDMEWWQAFAMPWNGWSFFHLPGWIPSLTYDCTDSFGTIASVPTAKNRGFRDGGPKTTGPQHQWKGLYA